MASAAGRDGLQFRLVARPRDGRVTADLFEPERVERPAPGPGQMLIRVIYLSLEPAMRGWIDDLPNYRDPVPLGAVMHGFTVGEVVASNHRDYAVGDLVAGRQGWREWALSDGSDIDRKLDPGAAPLTANLHLLGLTGLTGYIGLTEVGRPAAGETVAVSTAAGAVGSTVGQVAKILGCRTVGITGSAAKVAACQEEFGYDAAIDYKQSPDLLAALREACPRGIDVYFDNVGGPISDAVMALINEGARIVICGTMGLPSRALEAPDAPQGPRYQRQLLVKRARMEGFLILDHLHRAEPAREQLADWLRAGRLACREDIAEGLELAPGHLLRLLAGENRGKALVRVGPEP